MPRNTGHISLIVKGPLKNVRRAAQRHDLGLESCRTVSSKFGDVQCYAACTEKTNGKVMDWYTERSRSKAGRGFPPGTLLYHGAFCSKDLSGPRRAHRAKRRK
jgi:hypothetical protein